MTEYKFNVILGVHLAYINNNKVIPIINNITYNLYHYSYCCTNKNINFTILKFSKTIPHSNIPLQFEKNKIYKL